MNGIFIGLLVALIVLLTWRFARRGRRGRPDRAASDVTFESFITSMRAVGELLLWLQR